MSSLLPGRTGKQCRERWLNHLSDGIKKGEWSEEEDRRITTMRLAIGNQWSKVSPGYQFTSIIKYHTNICNIDLFLWLLLSSYLHQLLHWMTLPNLVSSLSSF